MIEIAYHFITNHTNHAGCMVGCSNGHMAGNFLKKYGFLGGFQVFYKGNEDNLQSFYV